MADALPLSPGAGITELSTEHTTPASSKANGLNAHFGEQLVHCIAAEPHQTFLRVSVVDRAGGRAEEVAYEALVMGRLRGGYRVFHLRSMHGTHIERCCLFVHISFGLEQNSFARPKDQQHCSQGQLEALTQELTRAQSRISSLETSQK